MKRPCCLDKAHDVNEFDCGDQGLNNYLKQDARQSQPKNTAATFVCLEDNNVIAYYSFTIGAIMHEQALERTVKESGAYNVPVLLIDRLAVDRRKQRQHIGRHMLQDALLRACAIVQEADINCIVANAIDKRASQFYAQFDFAPWPIDNFRLYLLLKDMRKTFVWS
jgi:GNAT superfamily N-acetyltransferase